LLEPEYLQENKYKFYIFELKNNKFYLAIPAMLDILDDVDPSEKVIKIFPLRSGHRDRETFKVEYYNEYISDTIQEEIAQDDFSSIANLKPISIFVREILTYRELDPLLFKKFGHTEERN
jgi:hypothetical protein